MKDIRDLVASVYNGQEQEEVLAGIEGLIDRYRGLKVRQNRLSEKDVVLITYGDQVSQPGESKLSTLKRLLDEFTEGSISTIHILPFYPYTSDDGFAVVDYYKVNPDWGSWDDIKKLSDEYQLMFDAVINHTSSQAEWFQGFLNDLPDFKNYYIEVNDLGPYRNVTRPRTSPLLHSFPSRKGGKNVWTTFSKDQVDLNYRNPKVVLQIIDLLLFYVSRGASLIRLDAIGFMWKEPNTTCIHLEQTHALIKLFRKVIEKLSPETLLITETNVPHPENISYFGKGDEAHMVYNFALPPLLAFSLLQEDTDKLTGWAKSLKLDHDKTCFFNFLASHDGIGVRPTTGILDDEELDLLIQSATSNDGRVSYRSNPDGKETPYEINTNYFSLLKGREQNESLGYNRLILAHSILLAMPGVPALYFHSLVGSENYLEGISRGEGNRSINREKLEYQELKTLLEKETSRNHKIFQELLYLIKLRSQEPLFHPFGQFAFDDINGQIFHIQRTMATVKGSLNCFFNFSSATATLPYKGKGIDLISGNTIEGEYFELPGYQFIWVKSDN